MIRRRRNEELRDAKRQNCEMKKECEELRRIVAHHKAVGMHGQKTQEKVRKTWDLFLSIEFFHCWVGGERETEFLFMVLLFLLSRSFFCTHLMSSFCLSYFCLFGRS